MFEGSLCDVQGIRVGNAQDVTARTGVTAVLCPDGAVAGVDVRGAAPGSRETDLLRTGASVRAVHAVLLCGGSAFGLAAVDGAMRYLEDLGIGLDTGICRVPIVPAAVLFDLAVGSSTVRPTAEMGYAACRAASDVFAQGPFGAGCGATIGKLIPGADWRRGGLGSSSLRLAGGTTVAAIAAVNAAGDVYHPHTGMLLAGGTVNGKMVSAHDALIAGARTDAPLFRNTTIGVVATDAKLTKEQANRLALVAHDGLARSVRPAHTEVDGDTVFALATGACDEPAEMIALCAAAAEAFARAVCNAVVAGG